MLTINVCVGSACHVKGAYNIINILQELIEKKGLGEQVTVKAALCLGECANAVSVMVEDGPVHSVKEKNAAEFFEQHVMSLL